MTPDEIRLHDFDVAAGHVTEIRGRSFTSSAGWTMLNAEDYSELICAQEQFLKAKAAVEARGELPDIDAQRQILSLKCRVTHLEGLLQEMIDQCGISMYPRELRKRIAKERRT